MSEAVQPGVGHNSGHKPISETEIQSGGVAVDRLRSLVERVELWLPVVGYESFYEVSNHGRVKRVASPATDGGLLKPSLTHGYFHVSLSKGGEVATHRIHVLVLTAFCGAPPFAGAHGAHNDGDKTNCHLTNLRWTTPVENQADVERHGRRCRGEDVYGAVLDAPRIRKIRDRIQTGERNKPIAESFGVSVSTIHLIRHNRIWRHV